jgi:hypothetical protein
VWRRGGTTLGESASGLAPRRCAKNGLDETAAPGAGLWALKHGGRSVTTVGVSEDRGTERNRRVSRRVTNAEEQSLAASDRWQTVRTLSGRHDACRVDGAWMMRSWRRRRAAASGRIHDRRADAGGDQAVNEAHAPTGTDGTRA